MAYFILLVQYQQASMRLVSAFRRKRRRLCLNRARFRNLPWLRSFQRPAESWFEIGTMYRTSLSFIPLIFLVAACTAFASFYNSNGRRSTRWNRFFSKLPPVTGLMVRVDHSNKKVAKTPRYPEGQMDKEKKLCPAIARIATLADHKVLLPLKYYLNMSRVQWQLNC